MERLMALTCETEGCENKGLAIELNTDAQEYLCGACMQFITNAVEVQDAGTETK